MPPVSHYRKVKIYGERGTGGRFVEDVIRQNCDVQIVPGPSEHISNRARQTIKAKAANRQQALLIRSMLLDDMHFAELPNNGGWRHTAITPDIISGTQDAQETLFICVVRHPARWLQSLHKNPLHSLGHIPEDLSDFMRTPWLCLARDGLPKNVLGSPLDLYRRKLNSYIDTAFHFPNVILVNYEDFVSDMAAQLQRLPLKRLSKKTVIPQENTRLWLDDKAPGFKHYKKNMSAPPFSDLSEEDVSFITSYSGRIYRRSQMLTAQPVPGHAVQAKKRAQTPINAKQLLPRFAVDVPTGHSLAKPASLWIGSHLGRFDILCLQSYSQFGQPATLFSYGKVENAPSSVILRDANEIWPLPEGLLEKAGPAFIADIFRIYLNKYSDFTWVDTDMLAVAPLSVDAKGYALGETTDNNEVNNAVLRVPQSSALMDALFDMVNDPESLPPHMTQEQFSTIAKAPETERLLQINQISRTIWGPPALTYQVDRLDITDALRAPSVLYPIPWTHLDVLFNPYGGEEGWMSADTQAVHLWSFMLRQHKRRPVPPTSFIGKEFIKSELPHLMG